VVSGRHAYGTTGWFTLKVHITDAGGSTADVTEQLLVFGTAVGGTFVIGDRSAALAKPVNFWGDQ
jgi:hypothetical protein